MKPLARPALQAQHTLKPTPPSPMKYKHQRILRAVNAVQSKVGKEATRTLQVIQALIMAMLLGVLAAGGGGGGFLGFAGPEEEKGHGGIVRDFFGFGGGRNFLFLSRVSYSLNSGLSVRCLKD